MIQVCRDSPIPIQHIYSSSAGNFYTTVTQEVQESHTYIRTNAPEPRKLNGNR